MYTTKAAGRKDSQRLNCSQPMWNLKERNRWHYMTGFGKAAEGRDKEGREGDEKVETSSYIIILH